MSEHDFNLGIIGAFAAIGVICLVGLLCSACRSGRRTWAALEKARREGATRREPVAARHGSVEYVNNALRR